MASAQAYHEELSHILETNGEAVPSMEMLQTSLELALCDWRRFTEIGLGGWGDSAANRRTQVILERLDGGCALESEQAYVTAIQAEFPIPELVKEARMK